MPIEAKKIGARKPKVIPGELASHAIVGCLIEGSSPRKNTSDKSSKYEVQVKDLGENAES